MNNQNELTKPDNATLVIRRLLDAPAELAFDAWTTPDQIQRWMRPEPGMEIPFASMDLKPGGRFRIQMKNPEGEYYTAAGEFHEVVRPSRLVYTWDWEVDGSGAEPGELEGKTSLITIEFIACGARTEFIMTHTRFATIESRDSHAGGWGRAVETFAAHVAGKA
ncbi:SRPBCC domain-containing protein [Luteolibacter sp. SL250]|uniref:SRPBCC family protein n=1 Tax=Luteolibacter sp. SL250 TaxID=2995170 RepID=UPI00226D7666|nr:SRPBCC domain-containing protein [Luteolibacter sp. SL250]WAC21747.1 SRPBCC domain-containing protein [Luteolibacter sp. SL250]